MINPLEQKASGVSDTLEHDFALLLTLLDKKPEIALQPIMRDKYAINNLTKKVKSMRTIPCSYSLGLMP